LDGVHGVFSVQNHHLSGYEGEVRQGKQVAEVAKRVGVAQLVYSGAGPGVQGSGVGSWETKLEVAAYLRALDLPATVLHPTAFMELMTERKVLPACVGLASHAQAHGIGPTGGVADGRGSGRHRGHGLR
jgi:uncharacterized protein YbjT (DUF2867 family)